MPHDDLSINPVAKNTAAVKMFLARVRDVVLPPQCPGCRDIVDAPDTLCGSCWAGLHLIGPACCDACGLPFPFEQDAPLCASCAGRLPPFQRARSAVIYDTASRDLILAFKHADRTETASLFASWMATAAPQLIDDADLIVPVPLDRRRLFDRRYNQAALLAQGLARLTEIPCLLDGVERIKPSPPIGKGKGGKRMSRTERRRNVAGAFRVCEASKSGLRGKRVLVVDDVYTSGATAWAMARCLKRAGVQAVDVLTVARVVYD